MATLLVSSDMLIVHNMKVTEFEEVLDYCDQQGIQKTLVESWEENDIADLFQLESTRESLETLVKEFFYSAEVVIAMIEEVK